MNADWPLSPAGDVMSAPSNKWRLTPHSWQLMCCTSHICQGLINLTLEHNRNFLSLQWMKKEQQDSISTSHGNLILKFFLMTVRDSRSLVPDCPYGDNKPWQVSAKTSSTCRFHDLQQNCYKTLYSSIKLFEMIFCLFLYLWVIL